MEIKKVCEQLNEDQMRDVENYGKEYIDFLSKAKTERMAVDEIVRRAEAVGFLPLEKVVESGKLSKGDKVYAINKNKAVVLFVMGDDLLQGMDIVGSHIDSPRLDLKQNPLYEDGNMAMFKTHYYGGVKKYQWVTLPLALHGVIYTKSGKCVELHIGDEPNDPVFYINDLLPHLGKDQSQKKAGDVITGEQLNIVVAHNSRQGDKDSKNPIKDSLLTYLKAKYDIEEDDFRVAEIEAVPAGPAREVGFDRSMIAGHGHDDRVCSFANLKAILEVENPQRTAVSLFVDKEEIGSVGNTGMTSKFFENVVAELLELSTNSYKEIDLKRSLARSRVLSADVNAAYDPNFPEVSDKLNTPVFGGGVSVAKYTGSRGKNGCNDANAEFLNDLRMIFDKEGIIWQTGELGAVDQGGGGTIAYILAEYGAEVVDCGTAMLSMHAPIELVSKFDAYETYRAYRAFLM